MRTVSLYSHEPSAIADCPMLGQSDPQHRMSPAAQANMLASKDAPHARHGLVMTVATAVAIIGLNGCGSTPSKNLPGKQGPVVPFQTQMYFGSPLAGPNQTAAAGSMRSPAWTFSIEAYAFTGPLPEQGTPLIEQASMVVDPRRANPIMASAQALSQSLWLEAPAHGTWLMDPGSASPSMHSVREEFVALQPGQTFELALRSAFAGQSSNTRQDLALGKKHGLVFSVSRTRGSARGFKLTLAATDGQSPIEVMQWAEPWQTDQGSCGLSVSLADDSGTGLAIALRPWNPGTDDALLHSAKQKSTQNASARILPTLDLPGHKQPQSRFLEEALNKLREQPNRSVLYSLASELQATHTQDWLLVCTEAQLTGLVAELGRGHGRRALTDQPKRFALRLEEVSLRQASELVMSGEEHSEVLAYLIRQTGQLAMYPDVLLELITLAESREMLNDRIAGENRIFLEDSKRSARLRAFEWLQTQGLAPHGYDPLSRSSQRQRALDRWREALDMAPSSSSPALNSQAEPTAGGSL